MEIKQYAPLVAREPDAEVEAYLTKMSLLFFQLNNEQQWDALLNADWIAPDFAAALRYRPDQPPEINLQQHVEEYRQHLKEFPDHYESTSYVEAQVDKSGKTANVYIHHETHAHQSIVSIPGVVTFMWKRNKAGKWLFQKAVDVRGPPI